MSQPQDQRNKENDKNPPLVKSVQDIRLISGIGYPNVNHGGATYIQPDAGFFISYLNSVAGVTLVVKFRYFDINSGTVKEHTANVPLSNSARAKTVQSLGALGEIYILDVNINCLVGTILRGTTFVTLYFARSSSTASPAPLTPIIGVLASGYVDNGKPLTLGEKEASTNGRGHLFSNELVAPGTGLEWIYTVPSNTRARVYSARFLLTTSAQVGTRAVRIQAKSATPLSIFVQESTPTQAASLAVNYLFSSNLTTRYTAVNGGDNENPLSYCDLESGMTLQSNTTNIQTGDVYSNIVLLTEEWYDTAGSSGIGGGGSTGEKGAT